MKKKKTNQRVKTQSKVDPKPKMQNKKLLIAIAAVVAATVLVILLWNPFGDVLGTASGEFKPEATSPSIKIEDLEDTDSEEYKGLQVLQTGSYSGIFVEDGSNDAVSQILMIVVKNTSTQTVQYAQIELTDGNTTAYFTLSTLPPGESALLMEKNRMPYADGESLTQIKISNVALFAQEPDLREDLVKVQALDGVLNVTNISGQDIAGNVVIYYKNASSDMLYGGITYRTTISGGIKAGEVKQIVAGHFSKNGSRIMWITVE